MTKFEEQVEVALLNSLGLLNSLRDRDQLSMVPESEWASITAKKNCRSIQRGLCSFCK